MAEAMLVVLLRLGSVGLALGPPSSGGTGL